VTVYDEGKSHFFLDPPLTDCTGLHM